MIVSRRAIPRRMKTKEIKMLSNLGLWEVIATGDLETGAPLWRRHDATRQ